MMKHAARIMHAGDDTDLNSANDTRIDNES